MATIANNYVGNGSTVLYSFTFPYLRESDVKVTINSVSTTAYTFANATTLQFNVAPTNGAAIRIYRATDDSTLLATFYPGSAIRSQDLNENFIQNLYVTQESANYAAGATTVSTTALATANSAASTANSASTNAAAAVSTANTSSTNAAAAVTTANSAIATANSANSKADQAISAVSNSINYTLIANVAGIPASPANDTYIEVGNSTGIESFTPLAGKPAGFVGDSGLSVRLRYTTAGATWNWQNYYPNNAETRYLKLSGGTLTGNITLAGAPSSNLHPATKLYTDTALSAKLDTTTAASTYQTQAGMSSYVPASGIGSTVQAYDANTAKTNVAQAFSKAQRGAVVALTSGATVTPDFSLANNFSLTLGVNATLANPTNLTAGQSGVITITNGASYTLAYGSYWKFPGGTAPTLTVSGGTDALAYFVDSSTRITARIVADVK